MYSHAKSVLIFTETVAMEMGYCPWYDPASKETYLQRGKIDAYEKRLR